MDRLRVEQKSIADQMKIMSDETNELQQQLNNTLPKMQAIQAQMDATSTALGRARRSHLAASVVSGVALVVSVTVLCLDTRARQIHLKAGTPLPALQWRRASLAVLAISTTGFAIAQCCAIGQARMLRQRIRTHAQNIQTIIDEGSQLSQDLNEIDAQLDELENRACQLLTRCANQNLTVAEYK